MSSFFSSLFGSSVSHGTDESARRRSKPLSEFSSTDLTEITPRILVLGQLESNPARINYIGNVSSLLREKFGENFLFWNFSDADDLDFDSFLDG